MSRVLVTGSEGFVGTHLTRHLESQGDTVFGCSLPPPKPHDRRRACDITDRESVRAALEWAAPLDVVYHLAAITSVPESIRQPWAAFETNVRGTLTLLEALATHAPQARVVYVSTSEIYGRPVSLPVTETHPIQPENPYSISKAAADLYCAYEHSAHGRDIVRMRPFNHSGPGQTDQFVLSSFARQVAAMELGLQEPVLQVGNLDVIRDFLHVADVVEAYRLAADQGEAGETYNVCSGRGVRLSDAVETMRKLARSDIRVEHDPERFRPVDVPEIYGSHDKLSVKTGWQPTRTIEDLLKDLLDHWSETLAQQVNA